MKPNRIYFLGNPWPEGHGIKKFLWTAEVRENDVWFQLHLESFDYYSERDIEDDAGVRDIDDPEREHVSDWESHVVWGNYQACTLSSTYWHSGGFRVCSLADYSLDLVDGMTFHVDPLPLDLARHDDEALAFHVYLLGHDTAVDHQITFRRIGVSDRFSIEWCGKLALTYAGRYEPEYEFRASVADVPAPMGIDDKV